MSGPDLDALFAVQRRASRSGPAPAAAQRRASLGRLERLVREHRQAFADAIDEDFGGRSASETMLMEIVPLLNAARHARRHVGSWIKPERRHVGWQFQPGRAWVRHEPLGVVGIISPWNFPLLLALSPLIDAIAAGNRALLKPSELTPRLTELLQRLIGEHFAPSEVAVVTGDVEVARAFAALPFDHLVFTGSTAVGRLVMQAAAQNLTPVTLELGGKSPAILCEDYPVETAARSIAFGKFLNAGQTCIAPDYLLVPRGTGEAVGKAILARAVAAYPTIAGNRDYSCMITERHRARLRDALAAARAAGARLLEHPDANGDPAKLAPTVVLAAPADGLLLEEEIFGPILPIVEYGSLDEALAFVNCRDRPLALYCFTHDRAARERVLDGTASGGVTLNGTLLHIAQDDLPFGGVGASGIGAYHGRDGFRRLSHARAVYAPGRLKVLERLGPPWGALSRRVADFLIGR